MSGEVVLVELREEAQMPGESAHLVEANLCGEIAQLVEGKLVLLVEEAHMAGEAAQAAGGGAKAWAVGSPCGEGRFACCSGAAA